MNEHGGYSTPERRPERWDRALIESEVDVELAVSLSHFLLN
jgi:hypothetical protein